MRINNYIGAAAAALALAAGLAACGGKGSGESGVRQLSDFKNLTTGDTVAYYVGQMGAMEYWQGARRDTVMESREARAAYIKGLRAGYDAIREDDAYNQGYYMGMQMAMQMKEFGQEFNTTVNKQVLLAAFEDGLRNDTILNAGDVQKGFNEITSTLQARKEAADKAAAEQELKKYADAHKLQAINPTLYAAPGQGGSGNLLKDGDIVGFSMKISGLDGKDFDRRDNPNFVVGKMYVGPITQAVLQMRPGETRTFYSYAHAIVGRFAQRYGIKGGDLVKFTISLTDPKSKPAVESDESGE